jgi:hypothetical protein
MYRGTKYEYSKEGSRLQLDIFQWGTRRVSLRILEGSTPGLLPARASASSWSPSSVAAATALLFAVPTSNLSHSQDESDSDGQTALHISPLDRVPSY